MESRPALTANPKEIFMVNQDNAAAELNQNGSGDDSMPEVQDKSGTFYLPSDFCEGMTYKKGDKITLNVTGDPDSDGDVPVEMAGSGGSDKSGDYSQDPKLREAFGMKEGQ